MGESFSLPSGRAVILNEPTFGDEIHAINTGFNDAEEFLYAKCAVVVPDLTRPEIAALSRADGRALLEEVNRIWHGRPEEKEIPFESKSPQASPEAPPTTPTP